MAGKKKENFHITIAFTCNADGSECLPPIYIGKAEKPHCFKTQTPVKLGFYYQNNKKAWMTSELFDEHASTWCSKNTKPMLMTDILETSTSRCAVKNDTSPSCSITSLAILSAMNLGTSDWCILSQIWLHLFSHWMQELFDASKLIIDESSVFVLLKRMCLGNVTFTRSTCLKECLWRGRHGSRWITQQYSIAGTTPKFKGE